MPPKTSELEREVESLRDRVDRLEGHLACSSSEGADPLPLLREHFAAALTAIPDVIGAALEEVHDGWRVWTYLAGWERPDEKAVYAAEYETVLALGAVPLQFVLEPESSAQEFEASTAGMTVIYRRQ